MKKMDSIIKTGRTKKCIGMLAILGVGSIFYSLQTQAKCTTFGNPSVTFPDKIIIPRDMKNKQVIASVTTTTVLTCDNSEFDPAKGDGVAWKIYISSITGMSRNLDAGGMRGVYNTNIKGVGLRWKNVNKNKREPDDGNVMTAQPLTASTKFRSVKGKATFEDTFELVKTGPVSAEQLQSIIITMKQQAKNSGNHDSELFSYQIAPASVNVQACSVISKLVPVKMDIVTKDLFTRLGSTAKEKAFTIDLDCDANVPVKITLAGQSMFGNGKSGVLNADTDSTSKGVGVQILHDGKPVAFETAINVGRKTGATQLPFSARYFQTENKILAGELKATATFTLRYR